MYKHLAVILALTVPAAADYEAALLPAVVDGTTCKLADMVPTLLQKQFLFSVNALDEPKGEPAVDEEDTARAMNLLSGIVVHPLMKWLYWGFADGNAEFWSQGAVEIPDEHEGNANLNMMNTFQFVDVFTPKEDCAVYDDEAGTCRAINRYYTSADTFEVIEPPYQITTDPYDPTARPWYLASTAEEVGAWSHPYVDFSTDSVFISPAANLVDENDELVGVVAADVDLVELGESLAAAAALSKVPGTALYIMDSSEAHKMIIASSEIEGAAYDGDGNAVSALESPDPAISLSALAIQDHLANGLDPTMVFIAEGGEDGEKWYVQTIVVDQIGTLPFEDGVSWMYVVAQPATCAMGYVLDDETSACTCAGDYMLDETAACICIPAVEGSALPDSTHHPAVFPTYAPSHMPTL